jgi:hypothetical protein
MLRKRIVSSNFYRIARIILDSFFYSASVKLKLNIYYSIFLTCVFFKNKMLYFLWDYKDQTDFLKNFMVLIYFFNISFLL